MHRIKPVISIILTLILGFAFASCTADNNTSSIESGSPYDKTEVSSIIGETSSELQKTEAQVILEKMTLKDKICQMFIVPPDDVSGKYFTTSIEQNFLNFYNEYPVGGFIIFEDNLVNPEQAKAFLKSLNELSFSRCFLPSFLAVDEEGGKVARIANHESFDVEVFNNMYFTESSEKAYYIGNTIGRYLSDLGFNVDLAPVADVFSNSENKVIGERSFSNDALTVCEYALNYAKGLNENGIFATYKHFPGHGATLGDSHVDLAYTYKSFDELMECELLPFKSAADNNIDFVMTSHISLPTVLGCDEPVTFSHEVITGILKEDFGFKGLIITDSLKMGAVSKHYSCAESAVLSIKAGNDILLMPTDIKEAVDALVKAVEDGQILEERINESVLKIIEYKLRLK